MNFERPEQTSAETPESRFDEYYGESLELAQRLSRRWKALGEAKKSDPAGFASNTLLAEIDMGTRHPKTGIQNWFEGKMSFINAQAGDPDARSRMMYRVKEELERIEGKVDDLLGPEEGSKESAVARERKNIIRRKDVDETKSKDLFEDFQRLLEENGFKAGDKVVFFAEREREGVLERASNGSLRIRGADGNPWRVGAILMDEAGYIRRP